MSLAFPKNLKPDRWNSCAPSFLSNNLICYWPRLPPKRGPHAAKYRYIRIPDFDFNVFGEREAVQVKASAILHGSDIVVGSAE